MKTVVPLARIGNSQGIRLSKQLLSRYQMGAEVEMETTPDAIILRPSKRDQLSWAETYRQMSADSYEDWSDWEAVAEDGLSNED